MDNKIQLTHGEIYELNRLENQLIEIKHKIKLYKNDVIHSHGCKDTIGIMTYKSVVRNDLGAIIDETVYTFLAWQHDWSIFFSDRIIPHYSFVTSDGGKGYHIDITCMEGVEFTPLDDCTYEEAKRILEDVKKKNT